MLILENALALWLTNLFLINFEFTYDTKGVVGEALRYVSAGTSFSAYVSGELSSPSEKRKK